MLITLEPTLSLTELTDKITECAKTVHGKSNTRLISPSEIAHDIYRAWDWGKPKYMWYTGGGVSKSYRYSAATDVAEFWYYKDRTELDIKRASANRYHHGWVPQYRCDDETVCMLHYGDMTDEQFSRIRNTIYINNPNAKNVTRCGHQFDFLANTICIAYEVTSYKNKKPERIDVYSIKAGCVSCESMKKVGDKWVLDIYLPDMN